MAIGMGRLLLRPRPASMLSIVNPLTWHGRIALGAIVAAAAGGASYVYRDPLTDFYSSARDEVITNLGLGVAPIALWLGVFLWALVARRPWFRRGNLWLASSALVIMSMGIMGFFSPAQGALAAFTLDGDVSLGGNVGEAIVGPVAWLGAFRLLGILIAGAAVASPPLAVDVGMALARFALYAYLFLAVAIKAVVQNLPLGRGVRTQEGGGASELEPETSPEVMSPYVGTRSTPATGPSAGVDRLGSGQKLSRALTAGSPDGLPELAAPAREPYRNGDSTVEVAQQGEEEDFTVPPQLPPGDRRRDWSQPIRAKFNRFWTSREPGQRDEPEGVEAASIEEEWVPPVEAESDITPIEESVVEKWRQPSMDLLLNVPEGGVSAEEIAHTSHIIQKTLAEYGVEVEVGQAMPGPTVTMYGLIPGWVRRYKQVKETDEQGRPKLDESGRPLVSRVESKTRVKVDTILSREKDLALALKTPSIRIETPVMGESLVGIEVPNPNPSLVSLRSVMESPEFARLRADAPLPVALGKGSGGETVVIDLAKMPHLLIAGATGSGKSVCLNAIISCLLMEKSPEELRLLLVDPKRVELTPYNGIPHLLTPVVVETDRVVRILKGLIGEMLDRYRRLEEVGVKNIAAYNERVGAKMPFLVVAIDELADLMMSAAFDVEQSLCRLAQLGRATGIHLIVATQRPSVDVVTGLIKANFPSRISFGVTSQIDSRTILDTSGADKLLGRGDMLYLPLDASRPSRVQNVFISDKEINSLVNSWQTAPRGRLSEIRLTPVEEGPTAEQDNGADDYMRDEFLDKAIELANRYSKLSTSLLQRRLRIGYPRAARLMDQLEEQGVVGPSDGSKSRDVIINRT